MASTQSAPNMATANGAAPTQGANNLHNMNGDQVKEILTVSQPSPTLFLHKHKLYSHVPHLPYLIPL